MKINEALYAEIKEQVHLGCESEDETTSQRAFNLLAIFDAIEGVSDGTQTAEDLARSVIEDDPTEEEADTVECVECGAETADPGVGVRCEADDGDGERCGGRLARKGEK